MNDERSTLNIEESKLIMEFKNNILAEKSLDFGIRVVNCYKFLSSERQEYVASKQLYRSGTSIGANIHESIFAQSRADFVSKLRIALKEAGETSYWIRLLYRTAYLDKKTYQSIMSDCDELIRLLIASINTADNRAP